MSGVTELLLLRQLGAIALQHGDLRLWLGGEAHLVRERERVSDLWRLERTLP